MTNPLHASRNYYAMGFLGILEDNKLPHVPGTVILNEKSAHSEHVTAGLKHGKGKDALIVLVPQPADDPNDRKYSVI